MIDANAHITENGKWFNTEHNASVHSLLSSMDKAGVEKAVLVPFEGFISNEFIARTCAQYDDRFIAAGSINPARFTSPEDAEKGFSEFCNQYPFRIIKFHNRLHKFSPLDERFQSILRSNNNLPRPRVIYICGLFTAKGVPACNLLPPQIAVYYAAAFPNTTFVFMHACGSYALSVGEAIRDYDNVYLDISYTVSRYRMSSVGDDLKYLFSTFDRRLIWGSDFPEYTPLESLGDFNELARGINEQRRNNILSNNLLNILSANG